MLERLKKNYGNILFVLGIVLAVIIRYLCLDFASFDYMAFIRKWVDHYAQNGGWSALKDPIGDYNVVYQYIMAICSYVKVSSLYTVKFFSVCFDFILAWGCVKCLAHFGAKKSVQKILFICILMLPTVWLNSSLWGQCDSIYVSFIVWSLYFILKGKNYRAVTFSALAFTFKLQTVFIMPLFLILLFKRQMKIRHLLAFPVTYFVTCIPALLFGQPFSDIIGIYFNQMTEYPWLSMNAPTFWQMIDVVTPNPMLEKVGILLAGVVVLVLIATTLIKKGKVEDRKILSLALLFGVGIPFFLPHMHDRYFFLADILSVLYLFVFGIKRGLIPLVVQYASLTGYLHYIGFVNLYGGKLLPVIMTPQISGHMMLLAFVMLGIYWCRDFCGMKTIHLKRTSVVAVLGVIVVFFTTKLLAPEKISVEVNGKEVCFVGVAPYEQGETVMVPIKGILNSAGYFLSISHETGQLVATKDDQCIQFDFANESALVNGELITFCYPHENVSSNNYLSATDLNLLCGFAHYYENGVLHFSSVK